MPVHYKGKTGKARKKAYAEHKAVKKKQKKGNRIIEARSKRVTCATL